MPLLYFPLLQTSFHLESSDVREKLQTIDLCGSCHASLCHIEVELERSDLLLHGGHGDRQGAVQLQGFTLL